MRVPYNTGLFGLTTIQHGGFPMRCFRTIHESAIILHPGIDLESTLPVITPNQELSRRDDAWYLSTMSRRIFRAGLRHSMVDERWPEFERAFHRFSPERVRHMSDDDLDRLMQDRRLIRHWGKIRAVRENAANMSLQVQEQGAFGEYLAEWPVSDIVGLWQELRRRYRQLGGQSAPYFLRMAGKDTFLLTNDVIRALNRWGGCQGIPSSIKARRAVQGVFNEWAEESGRPLCQVSRILALSVDE